MKYILSLFLIFQLIGCEYKSYKAEWEIAPLVYKCGNEQSLKVERETKFCNENTSYFSSYCYGSSIIRNCVKDEEEKMQELR